MTGGNPEIETEMDTPSGDVVSPFILALFGFIERKVGSWKYVNVPTDVYLPSLLCN